MRNGQCWTMLNFTGETSEERGFDVVIYDNDRL